MEDQKPNPQVSFSGSFKWKYLVIALAVLVALSVFVSLASR